MSWPRRRSVLLSDHADGQCPPGDPGVPLNPAAHVLDNPVWNSLAGRHTALARGGDLARCYPPDVSRLAGVRAHSPAAWDALRTIVTDDAHPLFFADFAAHGPAPEGWEIEFEVAGAQFTATPALLRRRDPDAVRLGDADVPEMLELVARTEPGPFGPGTHRMGAFWGLRAEGRLVAMAGERLHPPGWAEISAVCTDPAARGQGLATRLIHHLAYGITTRGETPFLHTGAANQNAIRLYEQLGFVRRRELMITVLAPATP